MFKHLMRRLYGRSRSAPRTRTFRPAVEVLEDRITPTNFLWTGLGGNGVWENGSNWILLLPGNKVGTNSDASYPGFNKTTMKATTTDIATFEGNKKNPTMQNPHELASLTVAKSFANTLTLQGELKLNKGGSVAGGTILQSVGQKNGPIDLTGGLFTWSGGNLNYAAGVVTGLSTLTIEAGAEATFQQEGPVFLGDNLIISNPATLNLKNTGPITLVNKPTITNVGLINISVDNPQGLAVLKGNPVVPIQNTPYGEIRKSAGFLTYGIDDPLNTQGNLNIQKGRLWFKGKDAKTGYGVTQSSGAADFAGSADPIRVEAGYLLTGGTLRTRNDEQIFTGDLVVAGGTLDLRGPLTIFRLIGALKFQTGTISFYTAPKQWSTIQAYGGITIAGQNTTVTLTVVGGAPQRPLILMRAMKKTQINGMPKAFPAGYTQSLEKAAGMDNKLYRLTRQQGGGVQGSVWIDANQNGVQDAGEGYVGGIGVTLLDSSNTVVGTTTTDDFGGYSFSNVAAGSYRIQVANPSGSAFTLQGVGNNTLNSDINPSTGRTPLFSLATDQIVQYVDAGLIHPTAPTVTSVSPNLGPTGGGTSVVLTGSGFTTANDVFFGDTSVLTFTVNSDSQITVNDPPNPAGTVDVTVATATGVSAVNAGDQFTFVATAAPSVTSLGTTTGTTAGGTSVIVTGSGFTGAGEVAFGGVDATDFIVNSDSQITAIAPPEAAGTVDVIVFSPSGTSAVSASDRFTVTNVIVPAVTGLSTTQATTAGGTVITLTGSGFTGATAVSFGAVAAIDFTVLSDTSIVATAPAQAAGTFDTTVTTSSGTSTNSAADQVTYYAAPAPTLTALSVNSGPNSGGTLVVLTGSHFTGATAVTFGSTPAKFTVLSDSAIEAFAPADAATESVNVSVTTYSGTSGTLSFTYFTPTLPAVTSLGTTAGSTAGGTTVQINGSGFTTASEVDFGSQFLFNFVVNSDNQITAVTPPNSAGTVDVQVVTAAGTSAVSLGDRFSYTSASAPAVTSLDTTTGSTAGGTDVLVTGTNFTGTTAVRFGGVSASFTVLSDTSLRTIAPPRAAGVVDVTVTTFNGTSASTAADHFTYTSAAAPAVTSLATTTGTTAGGTLVGITGYGFTAATSVTFGTVSASFSVASDTLITAIAPPQASGTVHVQVTTFGGASTTGAADQFTYTNASTPAVTGLTPATGTRAGGVTVVISGSGFTGATAVNFGTRPVPFTFYTDTLLTAVAPLADAGTVDVRVTTFAGTSAAVTADHFTSTNVSAYAPTVTSVSPSTGSTRGGQNVTIRGTNFTETIGVSFGVTAASSFTILSDTTLTATAPAESTATVDVTVTTYNGTSSTVPADQFSYLSTAAPAITDLSPNTGTTAGGASVSITGTNFTGATAVLFGTTAGTNVVVNSSTSLSVTAPPLPAGSTGVTVTTPSGTSAAATFTVTAAALPTLTGLGTTTGTTAGGTSVALTGTNFTGATAVSFGGVAASSFTVNSSTSITAVSPPQSAGTVDVTVSTYAGITAASSSDRFAYTLASLPSISSLGTSTGTTAGGTSVTINGNNFTGATAVNFGNVAASSFSVVSNTQIMAIAPPQAAGTVDIQVKTFAGSSAPVSADRFTVTNASTPWVASLFTTTGTTAGGTTTIINGSGYTGATAVNFGTVAAASFSVLSDIQIEAVSPPEAAGTVHVQVTTFAGTSTTSVNDQFSYTSAAAPAVTGVTPPSGSTAGGAAVTVLGSGFSGATAVRFGTNAAVDFTVLSDGALLATAPAASAGTVDIRVTTFSGTSAVVSADHFTYTAVTAPTITSLNPSTAATGGGTVVTISGSGFLGATGVRFGSTPAASFVIVSDSTLSTVTPPLPAGTVDVTVSGTGGTTSALVGPDRFVSIAAIAPTVTGLGTTSGSTAGGTTITLSGSGFTGAARVTFGGVAAARFTVISDTSLTAVSPSQGAGTVDVVVATPTGTSAVSLSDQFTYSNAAAPSVTGLSLTGGSTAGGTVATVFGSGFTGATAVNFGTVAASFTVRSDGWLVATAPPQAAATLDVTVVTPSGTSTTSSADHFTYTAAAAPAVTGVTPNTGSALGGNTITLFGSNFTGASAVNFGTAAASSFAVLADNALTATAPAGTAGTVDITVVTPSGTSATGSADHYGFTSTAAPTVSGLSATSGSASGGTTVLLSGTGFTGATAVTFGGTAAISFTVNSDTNVTALAPARVAALVDVTVTTAAGTSATSSSDHFTYTSAPAPTVTGVSPNAGPTAGGTNVTISGSGFTGATAVYFGALAASFSVNADGSIFAIAPAEAAATVDVTVVTPSGTSATGAADRITFQSDAALTSVIGQNITLQNVFAYSGRVAVFTDSDTAGTAAQFTAVISWGDGQYSAGQIQSTGTDGSGHPTFQVNGSVVYGATGSYPVTIFIQDAGGTSALCTLTASVNSGGGQAPVRPGPRATGTTATATHGVAFDSTLASFLGSISGGTASSYTAKIDWGNGITSAGVIRATGHNGYSVLGSNTYATAGTYTIKITITDSSGASSTVTTIITVADAGPFDPDQDSDLSDVPLRALALLRRADGDATDDRDLGSWLADALGETGEALFAVMEWSRAEHFQRPQDSPEDAGAAARRSDALFIALANAQAEVGLLDEEESSGSGTAQAVLDEVFADLTS